MLKFFLNSSSRGYLRSLEQEFGESTNAIRLELNKFEEAGMLSSMQEGNKKVFIANRKHPLFENIHNMVMKYVGIDRIVDRITERLGDVEAVYLVGDYSEGRDNGIIDLFILAPQLNLEYLLALLVKVEGEISRKIRYVHFKSRTEIQELLDKQSHLLIWQV